MLKEEGIITTATTATVWVKTVRSNACSTCEASDTCEIFRNKKEMEVEVKNTLGAIEGDRVIIGFHTRSLLSLTFLLYIFPILFLIIGALAGNSAAEVLKADATFTAILSGALFFAAAFYIIKVVNDKIAEKWQYRPFMVKIQTRQQNRALKSTPSA